MSDATELKHRFDYHPPSTDEVRVAHESIRNACYNLAQFMNELLPEGREKSLVFTHLEECMYWANASVARTQLQ